MNHVSVRVEPRRLSTQASSRLILGNFIELGLGRQSSGMWSEMLYNRSFRTVPPLKPIVWEWLRLDPAWYDSRAPFWHSGYEEIDWEPISPEAPFRTQGFEPFKGNDSLGIRNVKAGAEAGIRQRGMFLQKATRYRFRIFGGFQGRKETVPLELSDPGRDHAPECRDVLITICDESARQVHIAERVFPFVSTQQEHELEFGSGDFCGKVVVQISFTWEGVLYLSWASLMPVDGVRGWRRDVVDLLRRVSPPLIRFPGGCFASFYDWRDGIGPHASRVPREPYFWGGLEENDIGIDELLDLCACLGSEPQVCVNMMTGSPQSAAELVEYCNGSSDTPMGRLREGLGIARTQKVRFWEMENEAGRKWSALQYAAKVVEFSRRMRQVDPSIAIMMEYYSWGVEWLPRMLEVAGRDIDIIIHRDGDRVFMGKALAALRAYNRSSGTALRQANTEWLADFDSPEPFEEEGVPQTYNWEPSGNDYRKVLSFRQVRWFYALNAASRILDYLSYGGEFALANFNNCTNTWGGNIINAAREGAWLSPAGRVFEFFRDFTGGFPLSTVCEPGDRGGVLNVQACENPSGGIDVYAVNRATVSMSLSLQLPAEASPRTIRVLDAEHRLVTNSLGDDLIRLRERAPEYPLVLDPLSVTHIVAG